MRFNFVTLFPSLIEGYFSASILHKAIMQRKMSIHCFNPRHFSLHKHQKVDDYQIGGGAGLLLMPQPYGDCLKHIQSIDPQSRILFLTPCGKAFNQQDSIRLAKYPSITLVCGRYEGFDERLIELFAHEVLSVGEFILTGGELASLCLCDSISRHIPGILGNAQSLKDESFENKLLEAPNFTKPATYHGLGYPSVYSKGNHSKIKAFKKQVAQAKTKYYHFRLYLEHKTKDQS